MGLMDMLQQYAQPHSQPPAAVGEHFDTVAQQASPAHLGDGIAAALRSDSTPALGDTLANLFGHSNPEQKAGLLNQIMQSVGPSVMAGAGGGILGSLFGGGATPPTAITPAQAEQVSPATVSTIANNAQQQDDSIVDRLGGFYAQHPTLVKTLGVAALATVMSHMSQRT
jgi:hypothetical protein